MVDQTLGQVISWYVCTAASGLFLGTRLTVRWSKMGGLYLDDYLICASFVFLCTDLAVQQRIWDIGLSNIGAATEENYVEMMKLLYPGSIAYTLSLWLIKAALVIFYKRVSAHTYRYLHKLYSATLVWLVVSWLIILFETIFRCYPLERTWLRDSIDACPANATTINYWIITTFNISTDLLIICLPISMVVKLDMPSKQKLGVAGIFALGFFVVIASIIRAIFSHRDETMLTCTVSMIETSIAIIATCLPTLRIIIIGHTSGKGTYDNNRYDSRTYELSNSGRMRTNGGPQPSARRTNIHRDHKRSTISMLRSDSEDELVKDLMLHGSRDSPTVTIQGAAPRETRSMESGDTSLNTPKPGAIEVTTEFQLIPERATASDGNRRPAFVPEPWETSSAVSG